MKRLIQITFLMLIFQTGYAQLNLKYLVIDRYGMNQIKLAKGDKVWFSIKGEKTKYKDVISELSEADSSIVLAKRKTKIKLSEISHFYFYRPGMIWLAGGTSFIGTGFAISSAVHPLVGNAQYSQKEHAILGASFLAIGQVARLFIRKKYVVTKNTRVRIMDLSFQPKEEDKEEEESNPD